MMRKLFVLAGVALLAALALVACRPKTSESDTPRQPTTAPSQIGRRAKTDDDQVYRYNQLLMRDSIRPIYEPEFVSAGQAELDDDDLVLAIEIDGKAKAYPIRVLNSREMVNDELAGTPILATW